MSTTDKTIPLFPLHTVLFPGGALPLRIFEPRYLDLISHCMKDNSNFGVCLIQDGAEAGAAARTYDVGTLVDISYFHMRDDGLLGITIQGLERFHINKLQVRENQLIIADTTPIANEEHIALPGTYRHMAVMLRAMIQQMGYPYARLPENYDDAFWVGARLTELLPLPLTQKQYFLQLDDPMQRLEYLSQLITELKRG